ncbi:serine/Threonine protein kinase [[Clostridium] sordellii]|uniref:serine/threonine-protein kinase n=1 Tax=Paraclostridium sordellii TaxID=1505 RepID=UPI0005DDB9C9|nr:serine/threonine-protein kinase [Paeniclostridium sordellii]MCQ4697815.1 serine/threonine protein kinase [Paeniclostridium sordellii]MDU4412333.1 serine/threonine-protein kinase [Paeniclostridium sordellii]MDU6483310.1 serine/threonine-protein kinase [Paeniclostridium sordellii]MRZ27795.1 protein kinase [Paeniclostridium sordellii]MVO75036.1 protein kinase [Paeniclostridium sordellii]
MDIIANIDLKIIKPLKSEGVNSKLYLVEDVQMGKKFILKKIKKSSFKNPDKCFEEPKKICKANHSNIIKINHVSYDDENIYITMPYYNKGSLYHLLQTRSLTIEEIKNYALDFLSAVDYIHSIGIAHCDIKPNNILISNENKAILTDFGSAVYLNKDGIGKLRNVYYKHIAPEQCKSTTITNKVDIYQIGTTLYRMCNGNQEYNTQLKKYKDINMVKIASACGKFPIRNKYLPHIPKSMSKIIEKCINVNPEDRYENVSEIIEDIQKIDENLNWKCQFEEDIYYFIRNNKDNSTTQVIASKDEDYWSIKTVRVNKETRKYTVYKGYCYEYIEKRSEAFKEINKIIALLSYRSK